MDERIAFSKIRDLNLSCEITDFADDSKSTCFGYKRNLLKTAFFYLLCFLSVGFLLLICYWKPEWHLFLTHSPCALSESSKVFIVDQYESKTVEEVQLSPGFCMDEESQSSNDLLISQYKYFWHKHLKYYYNKQLISFILVELTNEKETFQDIYKKSFGISEEKRMQLLSWYGVNKIDVEIKSYIKLFFEECADPFYIFQVCSCILWFSDDYYYYAAAIVVISLTSIFLSIYQTKKHLITLHEMIAKSSKVTVLQPDGNLLDVSSEEVVPGDVVIIPKHGGILLCDAVLINGTAIVNESMLTGESIPVTKTPITKPVNSTDDSNEIYNSLKHKRNTLFCGTEVLQTRYYGDEKVCAVVVKTGFSTMKGGLIRSILFPKPVDFQFFNDAMKFICVLAVFAVIGLVFTIYCFVRDGSDVADIVKKGLDVITIAVPPALPAAMSVGVVYALQRLKKKNIFCISPSRINISGKIKLFCFDKTGTLTEDGLDFCGIIRSTGYGFGDVEASLNCAPQTDNMVVGMATCHSLTILDGKICGDPLDEKMFQATGWDIEETGAKETERYGNIVPTIVKPKSSAVDSIRIKYTDDQTLPLEVAIIKQFTFSSELQRMSVIVRRLGMKTMEVFAKGSPEMIASLCKPSTVPESFEDCLTSYTKQGYRVIALAQKQLGSKIAWHKVQHYQRSQAESELNFLGFIVLKNVLKPETAPVITSLYNAMIRPVMVTGDNILTAVSVARECGMVNMNEKIISISLNAQGSEHKLQFSIIGELDHHVHMDYESTHIMSFLQRSYHLAVTGKVFAVIQNEYPELFDRLLVCGTIFARMLPDQKTALVEGLQKLGYGVGMCGDGANDCGALKRAHAGISLSEAEASVASPFTSKVPNISCVIEVIKEGRCALVTSFNIFKYMALYSMIQYSSVLMLYNIQSNLGDFQYLYIDLFMISPFAITMSRTGPRNELVPKRPLGRLVHPFVLFSLIAQILTQTGFQLMMYFYIKTIPSYKDVDHFKPSTWHPGSMQILNYENTALYALTMFQYIIVAIIFSIGKHYRKPFYSNIAFLLSIVVLSTINCVIIVKPFHEFQNLFQVVSIDDKYYYLTLFGLVACNFLVSYVIDVVILPSSRFQKFLKVFQNKKQPRNKYKQVMKDILNDANWPSAVSTPNNDNVTF